MSGPDLITERWSMDNAPQMFTVEKSVISLGFIGYRGQNGAWVTKAQSSEFFDTGLEFWKTYLNLDTNLLLNRSVTQVLSLRVM